MVVTQRLTPEACLSAPRRGPAVPNQDGSLALHTVSTHTFGKGTLKQVRVMELGSGVTWQLTQDDTVHDAQWVPGEESLVVWLQDDAKGVTKLVVTEGSSDHPDDLGRYVAGEFDGPVRAMKLSRLDDGSIALALVGLVDDKGELYNEKLAPPQASTARIYDTINVRRWSAYFGAHKYVIWYSKLAKEDGKWKLAAPLRNLLLGTDFEAPNDMLDPLMGDATDRFDISPKGIVFIARDPDHVDPIYTIANDAWYVPLDDFSHASAYRPTRIRIQSDPGLGMSQNPRFSPDGTMISFLRRTFASTAEVRLMMAHIGALVSFDVFKLVISKSLELSIVSFEFAPHSKSLYLVADTCGREVLYELELAHHATPKVLLKHGSVSAYHSIVESTGDVRLLTSSSSIVESSVYHVVDPSLGAEPRIVSTATKHGAKFGLSHSQVSEVWFEGAGDYCVQAWIVKPRDFDETKKYPFVLMIHGGPESAWHDAWQQRWNAALWAEQGLVIVMPNPTGSTGFGVDFQAGVHGNWGGRPYQDLVNCMDYSKKIPYLDQDRAVMAGASYGGYMANWINGHPLARRFKASISHDGILNVPSFVLQTDEASGTHDFGGPNFPWVNWEGLDKWNPARPELLREWKHAPPTLVVHSDLDYRCPIVEGLAVFKTLQSLGVPSRFLNFPDETHFVQNPENALVWHREVFGWIEKWIGRAGGLARDEQR